MAFFQHPFMAGEKVDRHHQKEPQQRVSTKLLCFVAVKHVFIENVAAQRTTVRGVCTLQRFSFTREKSVSIT